MYLENGIVVAVDGENITVELDACSFCKSCAAREGCMVSDNPRKRTLIMKNSLGAHEGDLVSFSVEEKGVVLASLLLYLLPVVLLISGLFVGRQVRIFGVDSDITMTITAIIFLLISFSIIWIFSFYTRKNKNFIPVLHNIVDEAQSEGN